MSSCLLAKKKCGLDLCCFEALGAVLCEFSCSFLQVGHASALTLRVDLLVPSSDLNSVVYLVYSLELLGAVRLEPKWRRYRAS